MDDIVRTQQYITKYVPHSITGVDHPESMTTQDVHYLAMYAGTLGAMSTWLIGDCLMAAVRLSPEAQRQEVISQVLRLAKQDWSWKYGHNVLKTCLAFPIQERHPDCSFELHRIVSHLEKDEAHALLDLAAAEEWSAAQLRRHLYGDKSQPENGASFEIRSISPTEMEIDVGHLTLVVVVAVDDGGQPSLGWNWK